jgi:hypothetical protein
MEDVKGTLFASDNDEKYVDEVPDVSSSDKVLDDAYEEKREVSILTAPPLRAGEARVAGTSMAAVAFFKQKDTVDRSIFGVR